MITFTLESATETLDLNALTSATEGAQAQAGLSGLGLPSLDVQWVSGAGDGATYRGQRVLPRDIDIPIEFVSLTRAGLITQMDTLSRILSGEATLRATDGATVFTTKVHRVGGGDYNTGMDTNGIYNMKLTITLRAGNPFWISTATTTVQQTNAGGIGPTMTLSNTGTADAYPVWTFDGPGLAPKLTSPSGEVLAYSALVPPGGKLIIDTEAGTVVDELGNNRYAGLAAAPRFFKLKPGSNVVSLSYDRSSAAFTEAVNGGDFNFVTNPKLTVDAAGYTLTRFTRDATFLYLKSTKGYVELSPADSTAGPSDLENMDKGEFAYCSTVYTASGLAIGTPVEIRFDYSELSGTPAKPAATHGFTVFDNGKRLPKVKIVDGATTTYVDATAATGTFAYTYTPSTSNITISVMPSRNLYFEGAGGLFYQRGAYFWENSFDNFYVGTPGVAFFAGDSTLTGYTFSWTGTANASISKKVLNSVNVTTAKATCAFKPRKWMVV